MIGRLAIAAASLVVLTPAGGARADLLDEAWRRGNDAYFRGDYGAAVVAFEQLDRQGVVSADLAYNLGVAYFRTGALGKAIWAFERAAAIDPEADDARFNLTQARKLAERRVRDKLEGADREPLWTRAATALPTSTLTWLFTALYVGCFLVLFLRRRADADSRAPLTAAAALLGVGVLLSGGLLGGRALLDRLPYGVVLPDRLAVKEGADPNYRTSFDVHAGLKVRLLEEDHDWVRVRLANGLEGWVREQDVGRL